MKLFFRSIIFLCYLLLIILVAILHLSVNSFLSAPFNNINILLMLMVLLLAINPSAKNLFFTTAIAFTVEAYSVLPFGILLSAFLVSSLVVHWFLMNFFTNRSPYIIGAVGLIAVVSYRLWFLAIWLFYSFLVKAPVNLGWELLINFVWEILFTTAGLTLFYIIAVIGWKRLRPEYIHIKDHDIYGKRKTII